MRNATWTGTGEILAGVAIDPSVLVAHFSVSGGTLAYIQGAEADSQTRLVLRNRAGEEIGTVGPPGSYYTPRFSPDGNYLAYVSSETGRTEVFLRELATAGVPTAASCSSMAPTGSSTPSRFRWETT